MFCFSLSFDFCREEGEGCFIFRGYVTFAVSVYFALSVLVYLLFILVLLVEHHKNLPL